VEGVRHGSDGSWDFDFVWNLVPPRGMEFGSGYAGLGYREEWEKESADYADYTDFAGCTWVYGIGKGEQGIESWQMSNHRHLIAVPAREDSWSVLLRRVHGRLWQNPFLSRKNSRSAGRRHFPDTIFPPSEQFIRYTQIIDKGQVTECRTKIEMSPSLTK